MLLFKKKMDFLEKKTKKNFETEKTRKGETRGIIIKRFSTDLVKFR